MERGATFSIPSAVQKRPWAKGRSADITRTTVFPIPAADSLNFRAEAAQTGVSRLGRMLRIFFFPAYSARVTSFNPPATRLKSGAVLPTAGRFPDSVVAFPLNVTFAMSFSFQLLSCPSYNAHME